MNATEAKAALDRFLADNDELEQLSAQLATFNIFRALKIEDVEIRHSNTLGWLLDPAESHGLGDIFLRRILSNMLLESDADIDGLSAAQVELMDFSDIEVRREWKHIDVLVIDRNNKLIVLIENKVGSRESPGQLARYRKVIEQDFPSFRAILVFLTLEGQPSEEVSDYIAYGHGKLLEVLDRIMKQRREQMPDAVVTFLTHYTDTLRRLTMQDNALVELCQKIYRKHGDAITLIVEYGEVSIFNEIASEVVGQAGDCEILYAAPKSIWFIPNSWAQIVPENGSAWTHLKRPVSVACWLTLHGKKVSAIFEVSRMTDPALRLSCVKQLRDHGYNLTKKAFDMDATYSRFYRSSRSLRDATDEEAMRDAVQGVIAKAREEFPKVELVFKDVFPTKE